VLTCLHIPALCHAAGITVHTSGVLFFCSLLVFYLIERAIETKVVDLDRGYVLYFGTFFFIVIDF
jgi:hypothetical protein